MADRRLRRTASLIVATVLAALLIGPSPALAHSIKVWVRLDSGATCKGRVYFPGGGRAKGVTVDVLGPWARSSARSRPTTRANSLTRPRDASITASSWSPPTGTATR